MWYNVVTKVKKGKKKMEEKKFAVDFSGYVFVNAENRYDAEQKVLDIIWSKLKECFDDAFIEAEGVEEE